MPCSNAVQHNTTALIGNLGIRSDLEKCVNGKRNSTRALRDSCGDRLPRCGVSEGKSAQAIETGDRIIVIVQEWQ